MRLHPIVVPPAVLSRTDLPSSKLQTWLQLRALVEQERSTPPLPVDELARQIGKSRSTLYAHLKSLRQAGLLEWFSGPIGLIVIFPAELCAELESHRPPAKRAPGVPAQVSGQEALAQAGRPTPAVACSGASIGPEQAEPCPGTALAIGPPDPGDRDPAVRTPAGRAEAPGAPPAPAPDQPPFCGPGDTSGTAVSDFNRLAGQIETEMGESGRPSENSESASLKHLNQNQSLKESRERHKNRAPPRQSENSESSPAALYRELVRLTLNPVQRGILAKQVHDLPRWRSTLEHWMAHRWNPHNLPGMLDLYRRGGAAACRFCTKAAPTSALRAVEILRQRIAEPPTSDSPPPDPGDRAADDAQPELPP